MFCKLALVRYTKLFTANLGFMKPVQHGSHNNSQMHVDICQKNIWIALDRYGNDWGIFLDRIITGDEVWVHHYEPESKRQSMEWKHQQSPSKKQFKTQPSAGKLMFTVFWDSQIPVLEHYQERGTTINSARYSEMLTDRLKSAIRSKRRGLLSKGCCTKMPVHILLSTLLKRSRNSCLKKWLILRIVLILPLLTTTCLVHSKRH